MTANLFRGENIKPCGLRRDVGIGLNEKIQLYGFNNLTKTLSFNIYDICYAKTEREKKDYIAYIDEQYNSERLTNILCGVTDIIGACVLNISKQDYDPQRERDDPHLRGDRTARADRRHLQRRLLAKRINDERETVVAHLDKSHVTVHTYPEFHPNNDISSFRVDIDVSTCGKISPLNALNFLIGQFDSDVLALDYRIRGFTRDVNGKKYYKDHDINSIQNYIDEKTLARYDAIDVNVYQSNIFHTKMMLKEIRLATTSSTSTRASFRPRSASPSRTASRKRCSKSTTA